MVERAGPFKVRPAVVEPMKLLAIDTCTEACSAALYLDGDVLERYELAPRRHAELLLPMVEGLLAEAGLKLNGLDGLAFGRGPGAFTGVRIGVGIAQGLAYGAELPVLPVSTLAALAQQAARTTEHAAFLAAIDARMEEVYFAPYRLGDDGLVIACGEERVCAPADVGWPQEGEWFGIGSGWQAHAEALAGAGNGVIGWQGEAYPRAHDIALLGAAQLARGEGLPAEQALPVYLRDNVAKKKGEQ